MHRKAISQGKIHEIFVRNANSISELKQLHRDAGRQGLGLIDSVSAVFISSEQIALAIVPYLLQNEVRIPKNVSLVTLDNSRIGEAFSPMWTSVDINRQLAAKMAAELLLTWDRGLPKPEFYSSLVPAKLVVRESSVAYNSA